MSPVWKRRLLLGGAAVLAAAFVGRAIWVQYVPGEEIGRLVLPGELTLDVTQGDRLRFRSDTEILFEDMSRNARPEGCTLELSLADAARVVATTTCAIYGSDDPQSGALGTSSRRDEATGMRRLKVTGQHVTCELTAPTTGKLTLQGSTNLATCAPRAIEAAVTVHQDRR